MEKISHFGSGSRYNDPGYREKVQEEIRKKQAENIESDIRTELRHIGQEVLAIMREEELEKKDLAYRMSNGREGYAMKKTEQFQNHRAQELMERKLNGELTKVEDLAELAEAGADGVSKREVYYEGQPVAVYDLNGEPFTLLAHDVDYRFTDAQYREETIDNSLSIHESMGLSTARKASEDPSFWAQLEEPNSFEIQGSEAKGNTISTSLITNNPESIDKRFKKFSHLHDEPHLVYGFDHLDADSIVAMYDRDGHTINKIPKDKTFITEGHFRMLDRIKTGQVQGYSELVLRRYSETGVPRLPDYILSEDDEITTNMLKHAAYFGIPIINLNTAYYKEKSQDDPNSRS